MPLDEAERVVEGARHLSLIWATECLQRSWTEIPCSCAMLMPQDRKIEVEQLTSEDAIEAAGFLAAVVGKAHGRQMDAGTRKEWQRELRRSRSKSVNAPSWLWTSLVSCWRTTSGPILITVANGLWKARSCYLFGIGDWRATHQANGRHYQRKRLNRVPRDHGHVRRQI